MSGLRAYSGRHLALTCTRHSIINQITLEQRIKDTKEYIKIQCQTHSSNPLGHLQPANTGSYIIVRSHPLVVEPNMWYSANHYIQNEMSVDLCDDGCLDNNMG
jgi:hypothetical protein